MSSCLGAPAEQHRANANEKLQKSALHSAQRGVTCTSVQMWKLCETPILAAAWLASGDWMQQLEALLAVRQPSEEDLTEVRACWLWVVG